RRLNVGEEEEFRVFILFRNTWLEFLEDVEVRKVRLRLTQIVGVCSSPAKRLARSVFNSPSVDAMIPKDLLLLRPKILADDRHHPHARKVARRQRTVSSRTPK